MHKSLCFEVRELQDKLNKADSIMRLVAELLPSLNRAPSSSSETDQGQSDDLDKAREALKSAVESYTKE